MSVPNLEYGDFHKFIVSIGIVLFVFSFIFPHFLSEIVINRMDNYYHSSIDFLHKLTTIDISKHPLEYNETISQIIDYNQHQIGVVKNYSFYINPLTRIFFLLLACFGVFLVYFGIRRWKRNQDNIDRLLQYQVDEKNMNKAKTIDEIKANYNIFGESLSRGKSRKRAVALIFYKLSSSLPGTAYFNFIKDKQVWFLLENRGAEKYRVYISVTFRSEETEIKEKGGYYGGETPWNLNAFSAIQAPGLPFPEKIIESAKQGKRIKVVVDCEVKDETDKLIEKKLPVTYYYKKDKNLWVLDP